MIRLDDPTADAIEAAVQRIEARTDVEVVVVVAPRSAKWRAIAWQGGALVAAATALTLELVPWRMSIPAFFFEVAAAGLLTGWLLTRPAILGRILPTAARRSRVRQAAHAAFVDEAVHGTHHRLALLVYVSLLEEQAVLIPDLGLQGRIPSGALAPASRALTAHDLPHLLAGLHTLGDVLAAWVPYTGTLDGPDLPDRPRFLS